MYQQNRNMNYQFSRDLPANGYGNSNRMEHASNWNPMNSGAGNYNSNDNYNGANYNSGGNYNSNGGNYNGNYNNAGNYPSNNNNGGNANALVQLLSLMSRNAGNTGQFSSNSLARPQNNSASMYRSRNSGNTGQFYTNRPNRPQTTLALMNRSRNGPNNVNRAIKPPLKRPQGSKPEVTPQKGKEKRGPAKSSGPPPAKRQKTTNAAKPINPAKPANAAKPKTTASKQAKPTNATKPNNTAKTAAKVEQKIAPTRPINVAVLPKDFPRDSLQPEDLGQLEEAIIDEVALGHEKKIHFTGVQHRTNMLVIECKDWDSYGWLKRTVSKLTGWKGATLMAILERRIPKSYNVSLFLPRSSGKTHEQILALIKAQNEGLRVDRWSIKSSTEENDGQTLIITIDGFSFRAICKNDNTICYRYGSVPVVKIEEPKTESSNDASVKEEDGNEAMEDEEGDEVDGDEVDLNEEDEEMPENGAGDKETN